VELAKIRASTSGSQDQWSDRIKQYLEGAVNPQSALRERVIYVAKQDEIIAGFVAGHLSTRFDCDGELQWIDIKPESAPGENE